MATVAISTQLHSNSLTLYDSTPLQGFHLVVWLGRPVKPLVGCWSQFGDPLIRINEVKVFAGERS